MYEPLILVGTAGLVGWILAGWFWLRRDRPRPDGFAPEPRVRQSDRLWDGRTGPVGYNAQLPGAKAPEGLLSDFTKRTKEGG